MNNRFLQGLIVLGTLFYVFGIGPSTVCAESADNFQTQQEDLLFLRESALMEEDALRSYQRATELNPNSADNWSDLCWHQILAGRIKEARASCEQAVSIAPWYFEPTVYLYLGHTYLLEGDRTTAWEWYQKSLLLINNEEALRQGPLTDFDIFLKNGWQSALSKEAQVWFMEKGTQWLVRTAPVAELIKQVNSAKMAGSDTKAAVLMEQLLPLAEELYGSDHYYIAYLLNILAKLYKKIGQPEEALPLLRRTLVITEKILGPDHPFTAICLNNLAELHETLGQPEQALPLFEGAHRIVLLAGDSWRVFEIQCNLMFFYAKDQPSLAIFYGKQAVNALLGVVQGGNAQLGKTLQEMHADICQQLASLLVGSVRLDEAQQVMAMFKEEEQQVVAREDETVEARVTRISYSATEAHWQQSYQDISARLIKLGAEYRTLQRQAKQGVLSDGEGKRLQKLLFDIDVVDRAFSQTMKEMRAAFKTVKNDERRLELELKQLDKSRPVVVGAENPRLVLQLEHSSNVVSVAFSRDSKLFVTGAGDGTAKLWSGISGELLRTLVLHLNPLDRGFTDVDITPDGKLLATGGDYGPIEIWESATGKLLHTLAGRVWGSSLFSPDGKRLVSYGLNEDAENIIIWSVATGKVLHTLKNIDDAQNFGVTFSPDGNLLAYKLSKDGSTVINLWSFVTEKLEHTLVIKDHINNMVFSSDTKLLAVAVIGAGITLFDVATGTVRGDRLAEDEGGVCGVAFSSDNTLLAWVAPNKGMSVWDVAMQKPVATVLAQKALALPCTLRSVAFSPQGKLLASVGEDRKTIKLWDIDSREVRLREPVTFPENFGVENLIFSPDGKRLAAWGQNRKIHLWDVDSEKNYFASGVVKDAFYESVVFSPDGNKLISGSAVWDLTTGKIHSLIVSKEDIGPIAFSPDGKLFVTLEQSQKTIKLREVATGEMTFSLSLSQFHEASLESIAFSPKDNLLAYGGRGDGTIKFWNTTTGDKLPNILRGQTQVVSSIAFSSDGQRLASGGYGGFFEIWDVTTGKALYPPRKSEIGTDGTIRFLAFSPDGNILISGEDFANSLDVWEVASGKWIGRMAMLKENYNINFKSVAFSSGESKSKLIAIGLADKKIGIWHITTGERIFLRGHETTIVSVAFSPDGQRLVSRGTDNVIKLWRVADGELLASMISFNDGTWVVMDSEGRFDTANLEEVKGLQWVMPDDPLTALPVEIFMRDYYEPRLLLRILNGEKFKDVPALKNLKRVQPEVRILGIEPDPEQTGYVKVTVEAAGASRSYTPERKPIATAAHDLRLFRNGQMVGYVPGKLAKAGGKPFQRSFRVRLPGGKAPLQFTAYAFNDDRVKSATAKQIYTPPEVIVANKPRAYLITIGVNRHDNHAWNLHYAANDARQIGETLETRLAGQTKYEAEDIVLIPLISDTKGQNLATKANLKAVLNVLAGHKANIRGIPGGNQLRQATPDDLVLISFSGHGYAKDGLFYLIPGDTGSGKGKAITRKLTAHSISSIELAAWIWDVDGGDMVMIVDACQSAASVGDKFKPGPMGSRGLGQLAFDKGMRILAASQADDVALEIDKLEQGVLSFELVVYGMKAFKADRAPKDQKITLDEWLSYGVDGMPELLKDLEEGKVKVANRGSQPGNFVNGKFIVKPTQQPALFDFSGNRRNVVVAVE